MPPSHPHLLTPYLYPPQYSLTVLTSVLGATSNWLVLRYLHAALAPAPKDVEGAEQRKQKVVLVSFMRGWQFWKAEARRLVSISMHFINLFHMFSYLLISGSSILLLFLRFSFIVIALGCVSTCPFFSVIYEIISASFCYIYQQRLCLFFRLQLWLMLYFCSIHAVPSGSSS